MEQLILRRPTAEDKAIIWDYRRAFLDLGESTDGTAGLDGYAGFEAWLQATQDNSAPETVRPGLVPETLLMAIRKTDGRLVGFIDIRHSLNDFLLRVGGHIGYSVRAAERRKGYAKEMLSQALAYCRTELGLTKVLVTCDKGNEGSRRTILSHNGVLENEILHEGERIQRYWITL